MCSVRRYLHKIQKRGRFSGTKILAMVERAHISVWHFSQESKSLIMTYTWHIFLSDIYASLTEVTKHCKKNASKDGIIIWTTLSTDTCMSSLITAYKA